MSPELLAEWKRLEDAFHDSLPSQGETGDPSHGKVLCQFLYDNSEAIRAEIERLQAVVGELREAAADAFGTLHYLYETSDDEHVVKAAKEARDKLDAALGKDKGSSHD